MCAPPWLLVWLWPPPLMTVDAIDVATPTIGSTLPRGRNADDDATAAAAADADDDVGGAATEDAPASPPPTITALPPLPALDWAGGGKAGPPPWPTVARCTAGCMTPLRGATAVAAAAAAAAAVAAAAVGVRQSNSSRTTAPGLFVC